MTGRFPRDAICAVAITAFALSAANAGRPAEPPGMVDEVELISPPLPATMPLPESPNGVYEFFISFVRDKDGGGVGRLTLTPGAPIFNELGDVVGRADGKSLAFDIQLKRRKVTEPPPPERTIYELRGKKIMTRFSLVVPTKDTRSGRLLVHDREGVVVAVVELRDAGYLRVKPCHPGCFPAGTVVETPDGPRAIDKVRAGDRVRSVMPDGATAAVRVKSLYTTRNRLLRVETDDGELLTTQTQPLCLDGGESRAAGELKAGDRIYRWRDGKRRAVTVRRVTLTDRETDVFNLILGDSEVFIAGGFLARSKPPGVAGLNEPAAAADTTRRAR